MPLDPQSTIIIAGGSGFLGQSLAAHLQARGANVIILSRRAPAASASRSASSSPSAPAEGVARPASGRAGGGSSSQVPNPPRYVTWDARSLGDWAQSLNGAAGLVNIVGRTVDCIKTPDHCDEILRSRVEATRVLGLACRSVANPPPVWVQMSTAHIYGDPPEVRCDEDSPTGYGLAPTVGRAWEEAFRGSVLPSQRGVVLRTSFVVGRPNSGGKGALGKLALLARLGLGGRVASGKQGMSWIHEHDMNRLFERGLADPSMAGVYVASSPNPVTQRDFMRELRRHAGGLGSLGIGLPATAAMVRLGAPLILRTDPELALYGRFVTSKRLTAEGFEFSFPVLSPALADLLGGS